MRRLILPLMLVLVGCATKKPVRVTAADFSKVETKHSEARQHTAAARQALDVTRGAVGRGKHGVAYQREAIAKITPAVATLLLNVPMNLRPEVEAVKAQVAILSERTAEVESANADAEKAAETANAETIKAEGAIKAGQAALETAKQRDAEKTAAANSNADIAERAENAKLKAQRNAVIAWACAGGAILGCVVLGYLLLKP